MELPSHAWPKHVRAILFDVDGTLVDNNDLHVAAWREAFRAAGHDISPAAIRRQVGKGADNFIPALLPDVRPEEYRQIEDEHKQIFLRDYLPRAVPFSGVRPLFERLRADGVAIVLASSSSRTEVDFHLSLIGCEDLVDAVTSMDDVAHSKPCPDVFEAALARLRPSGGEGALVVGDTPWDAEAAARAGLPAIGLRCGGFDDRTLTGAGMIALFDDPADLLARYAETPLARHEETI
jgi:HAD superfamily hydrolase (TIGR01509 family)